MSKEIIAKKIEQMSVLLAELTEWIGAEFEKFDTTVTLVHEYDFETDNRKFYDSLRRDFIPSYEEYLKVMARMLV